MDANAPAFPSTLHQTTNGDLAVVGMYFDKEGISIRAYIATKVMAAFLSNAMRWEHDGDGEAFAAHSVKYADTLIAELSKPTIPNP